VRAEREVVVLVPREARQNAPSSNPDSEWRRARTKRM
jgi:hypothetical protein